MIEENKDRYYETLEQSSQGWHEGKHDPWPYINFVLLTLKSAYKEFEDRVGQIDSPRGSKTEMVMNAIQKQVGEFRLADIERVCHGVGREWIRVLLAKLKKSGEVICKGKGPGARWEYIGIENSKLRKTRADIYEEAVGGFVIGANLPGHVGKNENFHLIEIEAVVGHKSVEIGKKIILSFGVEPKRQMFDRSEQLSNLLKWKINEGRTVIIVIRSAHLLKSNSILDLKYFAEFGGWRRIVGVVLLGDLVKLEKTIQKVPEIYQRSIFLPEF